MFNDTSTIESALSWYFWKNFHHQLYGLLLIDEESWIFIEIGSPIFDHLFLITYFWSPIFDHLFLFHVKIKYSQNFK